ncbi:hypothetical protein Tco_0628329 [Tanacetum coccineum]|uniref:Uncharacterized protein n=1 Tax=Tanacetum coccineum TaxID=301880 RepID=A0ABQ4WQ12_9ASTR
MLLNSVGQKGSRGNIVMPELHNKMDLLKERTGPLLRLLGPCLQIHFYLTLFGLKQLVLRCYGILKKEDESAQDCLVLPIWSSYSLTITPELKTDAKREGPREVKLSVRVCNENENVVIQAGFNTVSTPVSTASPHDGLSLSDPINPEQDDSEIPPLEDIYQNSTDGIFTHSSYDDEGAVADFTNLETVVNVSPIPTSRIISSHPSALILGDPTQQYKQEASDKSSGAHTFVIYVQKQRRNNHKDFQHCLFACFLSQNEPQKISEALKDESWVDDMQEELLQFKIQKVWILVDLPLGEGLCLLLCIVTQNPPSKCCQGFLDSDYAGSKLDRKSLIGVVIVLARGRYVAAASCCGSFVDSKSNLAIVSTDNAKLVPLGKVCTAIETLKKNTAKALISLSTTITLSNTMAILESCPKHNMVAYLEKTEGNAEFHEIIDFLMRSSIHHALLLVRVGSLHLHLLTVWTSAKSKIINNVRHITAKVAGKPVSISEASIRSDLLFNDANGIDSLPNQAIFDAIQLMGYEGDLTVLTFNKALFSPNEGFLFHTMNHCISSKSTYWDQIPTNIATAVICLTSNQKYNFSKLIFDGMLRHLDAKKKFVMYPHFISIFLDKQLANVPVPLDHFPVNALTNSQLEDEGGPSQKGHLSTTYTLTIHIVNSSGNLGGHSSVIIPFRNESEYDTSQSVYDLCLPLCAQFRSSQGNTHLKAHIKKLKKQAKLVVKHYRAWMKSVSLKQRLARMGT